MDLAVTGVFSGLGGGSGVASIPAEWRKFRLRWRHVAVRFQPSVDILVAVAVDCTRSPVAPTDSGFHGSRNFLTFRWVAGIPVAVTVSRR